MKLIKALLGIFVGLLVLLVVLGVVAVMYFDSFIKAGVEKGGTYALQVPVTLDDADLGILSGELALTGLTVANPEGFSSPHFLSLGEAGVAVDPATINQPVITLPLFALADLDINLQRAEPGTNYSVILDNLKRLQSDSTDTPADPAPAGDEPKVIINEVILTNIKVNIDLLPLTNNAAAAALNNATGGQASDIAKTSITLDEVKLTDIGTAADGGTAGVTISEATGIIVKALMSVIAETAPDLFPADLLADLKSQLASLDQLGPNVQALATGEIEKLGEDLQHKAQEALDGATDQAKDAVKDASKDLEEKAKEGLQGLIPGSSSDD